MIGRHGERGSGISVLAARHDDDNDDVNDEVNEVSSHSSHAITFTFRQIPLGKV